MLPQTYQFDILASFGTGLHQQRSLDLLQKLRSSHHVNLPILLAIKFGADEKHDHFLVRVLSDLVDPFPEILEALGFVNRVNQKHCRDALVKRSH
jgi:hypothetical protein